MHQCGGTLLMGHITHLVVLSGTRDTYIHTNIGEGARADYLLLLLLLLLAALHAALLVQALLRR